MISHRDLHRDLGYFYVGLIISFAASGLMMNHREVWHPEKYSIAVKQIEVKNINENELNDAKVEDILKNLSIDDKLKRFKVKKGELHIACENHDIDIDIKTGKGESVEFSKTPIISQMMGLHKNTSNGWIYYSDFFAISVILIAITGMKMIPSGKFSFKSRGWKLALAGILFPILFLLFLA